MHFQSPEEFLTTHTFLKDEKTVLFDTVDNAIGDQLFENLEAVLEGRTLDYVIVNHMEPDHASTLSEVVRRYPEVKIVCNAKTVAIIKQFLILTLIPGQ